MDPTNETSNEDLYEKGKIYKFDGHDFVEIQPNDDVAKIPVTKEAMEAVKEARAEIAKVLKRRPELDIVASAILMQGSKLENLAEIVRKYGAKVYQE